jgi:alpha-beta hydrolase superfamily lysophospholipase
MFSCFKKLPEVVGDIKIPTLFQKGLADLAVTGWEKLKPALTPENITVKEYEGLYHEVYNETEELRKPVLKDLSDWLEKHV